MSGPEVAIVTGSGSGIGRAIAHRLARDGKRVAVATLNNEEGARVVDEIRSAGGCAMAVPVDVSDEVQVAALVARVIAQWERIDILVNNAGINISGPITDQDPADWLRVLAVNLSGPFLCARAVIPVLRRAGGAIVNISSPHAVRCGDGVSAYATAKAGLIGLTRAMALDHAVDRIRVNAVLPGTIDTPMIWNSYPREEWDDRRRLFAAVQPIGRMGQPEEVASAVAFLVGSEASFLTGGIYPVDGGMLAKLL